MEIEERRHYAAEYMRGTRRRHLARRYLKRRHASRSPERREDRLNWLRMRYRLRRSDRAA